MIDQKSNFINALNQIKKQPMVENNIFVASEEALDLCLLFNIKPSYVLDYLSLKDHNFKDQGYAYIYKILLINTKIIKINKQPN